MKVRLTAAVRVARHYDAAPARVFDAWLDPRIAGRWLFATALQPAACASIDARVGGAFRFVELRDGVEIEHTGEYLEILRPRHLAFTLRGEGHAPAATRVRARIIPAAAGCRLTVSHERVPAERARGLEERWTGMLYGLAETLATR